MGRIVAERRDRTAAVLSVLRVAAGAEKHYRWGMAARRDLSILRALLLALPR
jgi:hypothetical protein